jgi:hypothetical protein
LGNRGSDNCKNDCRVNMNAVAPDITSGNEGYGYGYG